jgi:tetratricopeptide (TPR) repeat protein
MNKRAIWILPCCLAMFAIAPAFSAPYVPAHDADILEQLPKRTAVEDSSLHQLKADATSRPGNVAAAVALADAYYRLSQREGDPRYLGYAQAALAHWWSGIDAPASVLLLRATILQSRHQFDAALLDLKSALALEPENARAILVRATILTVTGKYGLARKDCESLAGLVQDVYVITCVASISSLTGQSKDMQTILRDTAADLQNFNADAFGWVQSILGEISERRGEPEAEEHFKSALAANPRDLYTLGVYADWLLEQKRPLEVLPLVENEQRVDALLLRQGLALKAAGLPQTEPVIANLRARFDASRARGDVVHRREEARFQLFLNNDPKTALRLAVENWAVQREPADLRILAEAAQATGDATAQTIVRQWFAETKLEYDAVAAMVK